MSWIKQKSPEESFEILRRVAQVCVSKGGPQSHAIYSRVLKLDYLGVIDYKIDYTTIDIDDAIYARQIQALYSKLDFLPLGIDRTKVAYSEFERCEQLCKETNTRLKLRATSSDIAIESILFMAQRKISQILGEVPDLDNLKFAFGPGANTNVKYDRANPRMKLSADITCSANLTPVVGAFLAEVPHWTSLHCSYEDDLIFRLDVAVTAGKLQFVPKSSKTNRPIVVEPLLNSFFQKGFGSYIRDRLLRTGVDLTDQSRNQELARASSVSGHLATVDLKSASDCLSKGLVWNLLPFDWAEILDRLRTPIVTYNGSPICLEKFSSMGNGFTFELESMIFYALAHSVCKFLSISTQDVSVYGDDIIIPTDAYDVLITVLGWVGFQVNSEKSYHTGPFRESCGADYLSGFDIRPYYQKTLVSERTLFTMHNWMIRHCEFDIAAELVKIMHPAYVIYGPDGYGDGHLIGSYQLRATRKSKRAGWGGGFFDTYILNPKTFVTPGKGDYVLPVYSVYTRSGEHMATDPNVVRGSRGYAKISIYTFSENIFNKQS